MRIRPSDIGLKAGSAAEARAQGVVFFIYEWDPAPAWDLPDQKKALDAMGIPTLSFDAQKYSLSELEKKAIKDGVQRFVETIRTREC